MPAAEKPQPAVRLGTNNELVYQQDEQGNRLPDFSHCGYDSGNSALPDVPATLVVEPEQGDDGPRIQAAVDYLSKLPLGENGFRGAVRLAPGEFQIAGQIRIQVSGIVLQGSGADDAGTTLVATGTDRRALVSVSGSDNRQFEDPLELTDDYVPVGATSIKLKSTSGLAVGDSIVIRRASTEKWIELLDCRELYLGWRPGSRDIEWERVIRRIDGSTITFDAPLTTSFDPANASGTVQRFNWPARNERVGVQDLRMVSSFDENYPADEDHAWFGIIVDNAKDTWVRRLVFEHFSGGAVLLGQNSHSSTVEDCISLAPVSELGGYRRHTYFTLGQLSLFNRCWSEEGRHDFSVGHCAAGPNAFVQCRAHLAHSDSGPIESWSSGVLYDNVRIDGNDLRLDNRWNSPPKAGWAAANSVLWQCRAANVSCFRPPGENNWAIGCWATHQGDGKIESINDFVKPFSLYQAQLRERIGSESADRLEPFLGKSIAATSPSVEQAAEFVSRSNEPAHTLVDLIQENITSAATRLRDQAPEPAVSMEQALVDSKQTSANDSQKTDSTDSGALSVHNGWIVEGSRIKTGRRLTPSWWRGSLRTEEAEAMGPNITRFAPGRFGDGRTNDLLEVAARMSAGDFASYEHHYGLWYERRRDDHLMVRRADGEVQPPFYAQPFRRTGQGTAWDGLSKYDLTADNPWYWNRLHDFAKLCDEQGQLLVHHNYFQHNILEAGAHWVDCPWRPANNINDVPLPEPPPFIGDKRIFIAHKFYDISNPQLRDLHRRYIRQCLDAFADCSNVLQMTSAEYTGPLHFTQFWLDTIAEWEQDTGRDAMVALSCTKDVQDEILAEEKYRDVIDVIDIRYWMLDENFEYYAPPGGQNLAPRQHMRQRRSAPSSFTSIVKAVSDYRKKFPSKAVLYNADRVTRSSRDGWAVLMGGGSLANVQLPDSLAQSVAKMQPVPQDEPSNRWTLISDSGERLIYNASADWQLELSDHSTPYVVRWIDTKKGKVIAQERIASGATSKLTSKSNVAWLVPSEN